MIEPAVLAELLAVVGQKDEHRVVPVRARAKLPDHGRHGSLLKENGVAVRRGAVYEVDAEGGGG